jgi:hypothetical protein
MKAFFKLLSPPAALPLGMLTLRYRMRRRVLKNAHLLPQDAARVEVFLATTLPASPTLRRLPSGTNRHPGGIGSRALGEGGRRFDPADELLAPRSESAYEGFRPLPRSGVSRPPTGASVHRCFGPWVIS